MGTNNHKIKTPEQRFWEKVEKTETCWNWTGAITTTGYGVFQKGRRGERLYKAHLFSYLLHKGEIPERGFVLHSCDNKKCVNPDHLSVGGYSQNIKEVWDRGKRAFLLRKCEPMLHLFKKDCGLNAKTNP